MFFYYIDIHYFIELQNGTGNSLHGYVPKFRDAAYHSSVILSCFNADLSRYNQKSCADSRHNVYIFKTQTVCHVLVCTLAVVNIDTVCNTRIHLRSVFHTIVCNQITITVGRISKCHAAIPGSSHFYKGGIIAYSDEVKVNILGVNPETLEKHGAVSEEVVIEMAKGAMKSMNSDCGVATSGIAGMTSS